MTDCTLNRGPSLSPSARPKTYLFSELQDLASYRVLAALKTTLLVAGLHLRGGWARDTADRLPGKPQGERLMAESNHTTPGPSKTIGHRCGPGDNKAGLIRMATACKGYCRNTGSENSHSTSEK